MQLKQKFWIFKRKSYDFLHSNEFSHRSNTFKGSVLSIVCGLVAAGIIVACMNVNPFEYLGSLVAIAFNPLWINQTFQIMAVLGVAGLAVAVAFEAGLFNIGVAGQMVLGVSLATVAVNSIYPNMSNMANLGGGIVLLVFVICVLSASAISTLSGWLKTQFNIHEVVSTIMLNYIVWYLVKFIFLKWSAKFASSGVASNPFPAGQLTWGTSQVAIPILVFLICVAIVWFIFRKTVFGFKAKAIGYSPSVSHYAGINVKHKILLTMALSGALAGVASFLNVFTIAPNISFAIDNLPTTGYDAIAIALVAFNNAWGVIAVSFLWAIFQSAGPNAATLYLLPVQTSMLVFGFVVYFAAISVVFIRWHPFHKLRLWYAIWKSPTYRKEYNQLKEQINALDWWHWNRRKDLEYMNQLNVFKQQLVQATTHGERDEIIQAERQFKRDYQDRVMLIKHDYRNQLKNFYIKVNKSIESHGLMGIKLRNRKQMLRINATALDKIDQLKLNYVRTKNQYHQDFQKFTRRFRVQKLAINSQYQLDAKRLRNEHRREKSKLTLRFELKNESLILKGQLRKTLSELKVEHRGVQSKNRLAIHLIRFDKTLTREVKQAQLEKIRADYKISRADYWKLRRSLKFETDRQIEILKKRQRRRANELQTDPTPLQVLNAEYQNKLNALRSARDEKMQEVNHLIIEQSHRIDPLKGRADLRLIALLYHQCVKQLSYLARPHSPSASEKIKKINQDLQLIRQTNQEIIKVVNPPKFQDYDDINTVRRKTRWLVKIAHLQYLFSSEKVIIANNQLWLQNRLVNQRIVSDFHQYEKEHNLEDQGLSLRILKKKLADPLSEEKPVNQQAIQEFIEDLEQKYMKARGN